MEPLEKERPIKGINKNKKMLIDILKKIGKTAGIVGGIGAGIGLGFLLAGPVGVAIVNTGIYAMAAKATFGKGK